MSKVFFISDLHIGHKKIHEFSGPLRGGVTSVEDHDAWILDRWNSVVEKRDTVWVLGDVCFDMEKLPLLDKMFGNKILVLGNHDKFDLPVYQKYFSKIYGFTTYKGCWISHAPIHPEELRNRYNIHGHVHHNTIPDQRYVNVCPEVLSGEPIEFARLQEIMSKRKAFK